MYVPSTRQAEYMTRRTDLIGCYGLGGGHADRGELERRKPAAWSARTHREMGHVPGAGDRGGVPTRAGRGPRRRAAGRGASTAGPCEAGARRQGDTPRVLRHATASTQRSARW